MHRLGIGSVDVGACGVGRRAAVIACRLGRVRCCKRCEYGGAEERLVIQSTNACELDRGGVAGARSKCLRVEKGCRCKEHVWLGGGRVEACPHTNRA